MDDISGFTISIYFIALWIETILLAVLTQLLYTGDDANDDGSFYGNHPNLVKAAIYLPIIFKYVVLEFDITVDSTAYLYFSLIISGLILTIKQRDQLINLIPVYLFIENMLLLYGLSLKIIAYSLMLLVLILASTFLILCKLHKNKFTVDKQPQL